ncbi:unnamed protein product [Rhizoctonia solani]|uniref:Uncharacterized protein n=1 Tax=Rhizoctonia solani TaxID=456999 RepID=A0A8H3E1S9_9AGAM|nr:unnamed protein product [Rhizoctonia solani]
MATLVEDFPQELIDSIARYSGLTAEEALAFSRAHPHFRDSITNWIPVHVHVTQGDAKLELASALSAHAPNPETVILDLDFRHDQYQEEAIQLLSEIQSLRHLALRQYPPEMQPTRDGRQNFFPYPAPLSSELIQDSNLKNLTHLELSCLSIPFFMFKKLPRLTHLKLTMARTHGYDYYDTLQYVDDARACSMNMFEISLHTHFATDRDEGRGLQIVEKCVKNWPELKVLNLISDSEGFTSKTCLNRPVLGPEFAVSCVKRLRKVAPKSLKLEQLSLGVVPTTRTGALIPLEGTPAHILNSVIEGPHSLPGLAEAFRSVCPTLRTFRCITPYNNPTCYRKYYEVARAVWTGKPGLWQCMREKHGERPPMVFGKEWENSIVNW